MHRCITNVSSVGSRRHGVCNPGTSLDGHSTLPGTASSSFVAPEDVGIERYPGGQITQPLEWTAPAKRSLQFVSVVGAGPAIQRRSVMPLDEPHPAKVWTGVILYFGIGVAIALVVAYRLLDRGSSTAGAIAFGACAGGYGAWFVFYIVFNVVDTCIERSDSILAMTSTTLDYATPPAARKPRRVTGLIVGALSLGLSTLSSMGSFNAAHSIRYPIGRDCFDTNGTTFWVLSPVLGGLALGGLMLCGKFGAGIVLARIGVLVAALMWFGSLVVYRP